MTSLKYLLETCFSPLGLLTILFAAGLLLLLLRRWNRLARGLIVTAAALYLALLLTPAAEILYAKLEHASSPLLRPDPSLRTVVVLSGYGEDISFLPVTSKLNGETISRMVEGIRLYRALDHAQLIVSGGVVRAPDRPIGRLMAEFAKVMGVPEQDIIIEEFSTTTYENLVEVKKLIGVEPFILVTSSVQMLRAAAVARKLGMAPTPAPAAIWAARFYPPGMAWSQWGAKILEDVGFPAANRLGYLQRAYHEYLGYAWYWMLGRV